MKGTMWYRIPENCERSYYKLELTGGWEYWKDPESYPGVAEKAGEDFWNNHDGWEDTWPLVISLHEFEEGPELGRYSVDMEGVPTFYASEIKEEK